MTDEQADRKQSARPHTNPHHRVRSLHSRTFTSTATDLGEGDPAEIDVRRNGITRRTDRRSINAVCTDCGDVFASTGTAAIHARSYQHTVSVSYFVAFTFRPTEGLRS